MTEPIYHWGTASPGRPSSRRRLAVVLVFSVLFVMACVTLIGAMQP